MKPIGRCQPGAVAESPPTLGVWIEIWTSILSRQRDGACQTEVSSIALMARNTVLLKLNPLFRKAVAAFAPC